MKTNYINTFNTSSIFDILVIKTKKDRFHYCIRIRLQFYFLIFTTGKFSINFLLANFKSCLQFTYFNLKEIFKYFLFVFVKSVIK